MYFVKNWHHGKMAIINIQLVSNGSSLRIKPELRKILLLYNGGNGKIGENYLDLWGIEDIVEFY